MSKKKISIEPEQAQFIRERYQDTSVVIFKEQQRAAARYLSKSAWQAGPDEERPHSSYRYSRYGNEAITIHKEGKVVTKKDVQTTQSVLCIVM